MKNTSISKKLSIFILVAVALSPVVAVAQTYLTYPDTTPPWVSRYAVTNVTPYSATINWTTNEPADGMVEFCPTWQHCNNFTPTVPEFTLEHTINLSGLNPGVRYYFYMYSRDQYGNLRVYGYRTFMTAWVPPVTSPTPVPTPAPSNTPWPTPFPVQTPVPTPDVSYPWPSKWSATNITPYSATINWTTNEPSNSQVEFCTSWMHCGNFTPLVTALTTEHQINLSGLNPYTRYYFYMYSSDAAGNRMVYGYKTFMTAWVPPVTSPTPVPTPVFPTPTPVPYPSQTPVPTADRTPPWVMRWTVNNITTNSARVEWITDEPSDGQIEFCPTWVNCANFTSLNPTLSTSHTADLTGLLPSKRYYFWMYSRDAGGNLRIYGYKTFYTAWQ